MAVTNTVQGLNSVIDLLKNILDTVKDDNKTVQPRDVSSVSRTTASNKTNIQDLSALNSISKNVQTNAKTYSDVIKTITSNEVISGIKQLALLNSSGLLKRFDAAINSLVETLNKIDNFKVSKAKIKNFTSVLASIKEIAKAITGVFYSLGKIILVAAGLGVLFTLAWPQILLGFAGITATMVGVLLIVKLMIVVQKILFGGASIKGVKSGIQIALFQQMVNIFQSLAIMILVAAAVGVLSVLALPQILIGFATISTVALGVLLLIKGMTMMMDWILGSSKGPEKQLGGLTLGQYSNYFKMISAMGAVAFMILIMLSISVLVLVAAGIGLLAVAALPQILTGFAVIAGVVLLTTVLMMLMQKLVDILMKDKAGGGALGGEMRMLKTVGSIAILVFTMLGIALLVVVAAGVGALVISFAGQIIAGLVTMFTVLGLLTLVMKRLMKVTSRISIGKLGKGMLVLGGIIALMVVMSLAFIAILNTSKKVKSGGGWGELLLTLGIMVGIIAAVGAVAVAIGLLVSIPIIGPLLAVGIATIMGISLAIITFCEAVEKAVEVGKIMKEADDNNVFDNMGKNAVALGEAISIIAKKMVPAAGTALLIAPALRPLNMLMNVISKFVKIMSTVGADKNLITPVQVDENGNIISQGSPSNMVEISRNIARAFTTFVNILVPAFENISMRGVRRMGRSAEHINKILDPVSKFAEIVSMMGNDPNFIVPIETDKDGNIVKTHPKVDMVTMANNLGSAFMIFVEQLSKKFNDIELETDWLGIPKIAKLAPLNGVVEAVGTILEVLSKYSVNSSGTEIEVREDDGTIRTIKVSATGVATLLQNYINAIDKINPHSLAKFTDIAFKEPGETSLWKMLNTVVKLEETGRAALIENAANLKVFSSEWENMENIIFKDDKKKLEMLKEYYKGLKLISDKLKEISSSLRTISHSKTTLDFDDSGTPVDNFINKYANKQSTSVETRVTEQTQSTSQIDTRDIAEAIKSGLSGSTVRFTFADSMDDFIGEMALS